MQSYPSARSANVLCDTRILRQLQSTRDYDLHVLCMRHPGQPLEEECDGLVVHRVPMGWLFEQDSKVRSEGDSAYKRAVIGASRIRMRVRQVSRIASYPYFDTRAVRLFDRAAESLYQANGYDLVAAEHYGLETMHAGLSLKERHPDIKYLQFFWDSISGGFRPKYLPGPFIDRRRRGLEKRILETADASVAMTSHEKGLLATTYGRKSYECGRLRFLGIPYLCDVALSVGCDNPLPFVRGKKNLLFAGNLWGRDPEPLVRALAATERGDVVLWLVSGTDGAGLCERLSGYGVDVRYHPYVEHSQLVSALCEADALVNFGVSNPNAISGKIIEYIGCCKPIISTYAIDDEACLPVLDAYPSRLLFDERKADDVREVGLLGQFLDTLSDVQIRYEDVARKYSHCLPEAYCKLIDELLAGDARG